MHLSGTNGIHVRQNMAAGIKIMSLSVLEKMLWPKNMHLMNSLAAILKKCVKIQFPIV
jgi:hypothetical protein